MHVNDARDSAGGVLIIKYVSLVNASLMKMKHETKLLILGEDQGIRWKSR